MKELNYEVLGLALKALSEKCFEAARQKKECQSVTGCGMDDDDLDRLCEIISEMMNPMMTFGQVKKETRLSEATLRRAIKDGELEAESSAGDKFKFFKKWKVREFIKNKLKRLNTYSIV